MGKCKHCGGTGYGKDGPTFVLSTGELVWNGGRVVFTPQEALLFGIMARRRGMIFNQDRLTDLIYAHRPDGDFSARKNIDVHVWRIRQKCKGAPFSIINEHGQGYFYKGPEIKIVAEEVSDDEAYADLEKLYEGGARPLRYKTGAYV